MSVGNAFAGQAGGLGGGVVSVSAGSGGFGGGSTSVSGQVGRGGFGGSVVTAVSAASSDEPSVEFDKDNRMVSIDVKGDFRGGSFTATMRKLAKLTKTSVVIDAGLYMDVTLVISDKPVEDAIEILCRSAKATYKLERGVYYISSTYVPGK
ncbi:hypothetical protein EON79_13975 [bacterium]|nr:MAG: hypothetical protein EON79_13975 [bacterium]